MMGRITCEHGPAPEGVVEVALSERNLLSLIVMLHTPGSPREIHVHDVPDGWAPVTLLAEDDGEHYLSPTRLGESAGSMHPLTEIVVAVVRELLEGDTAAHVGNGWML